MWEDLERSLGREDTQGGHGRGWQGQERSERGTEMQARVEIMKMECSLM